MRIPDDGTRVRSEPNRPWAESLAEVGVSNFRVEMHGAGPVRSPFLAGGPRLFLPDPVALAHVTAFP